MSNLDGSDLVVLPTVIIHDSDIIVTDMPFLCITVGVFLLVGHQASHMEDH